jgi:hypothetical protein
MCCSCNCNVFFVMHACSVGDLLALFWPFIAPTETAAATATANTGAIGTATAGAATASTKQYHFELGGASVIMIVPGSEARTAMSLISKYY